MPQIFIYVRLVRAYAEGRLVMHYQNSCLFSVATMHMHTYERKVDLKE